MASYDILVVGAGMFGSSAAKHIRKMQPHLRVAVVGPEDNTNANARGQHHDEARITRRVETRLLWEHLNNDSMIHYRETEKESGINFYTPCGCVWIAPPEDKDAVANCLQALINVRDSEEAPVHVDDQVAHRTLGPKEPSKAGSQIVITADSAVAERAVSGEVTIAHFQDADKPTYYIAESGPAGGGTVHPNRYVQAQLKIAEQTSPTENYTRINEAVVKLEPEDGAYAVTVESGTVHHASKVVVATGYWCRYHNLLPERITSRLKAQSANVVLLRVRPPHGDDHAANTRASSTCPSVIRTTGSMPQQFYCLPPRYYEKFNGWFIKMGEVDPVKRLGDLMTRQGACDWYDGKVELDAETVEHVTSMLKTIYVNWPVETAEQPAPYQNRYTVTCMVDETAEGVPIIDNVDGKGWYSCVAGNGRGAKSCDAVGRVTAHRVLGIAMPDDMKHYEGMFYEK